MRATGGGVSVGLLESNHYPGINRVLCYHVNTNSYCFDFSPELPGELFS